MGRPSDWMREVTGRAPMRSPGHPGHQRIVERRFRDKVAEGLLPTEAAVAVRVSPVKGTRWFRDAGGMSPYSRSPPSGRYLSFAEREEIALLRVQGKGVRQIATALGRSPSTISRELRRNAATRGGKLDYRALVAQWKAELFARRPKKAKLLENHQLRQYVQQRLAGRIAGPPTPWQRGTNESTNGLLRQYFPKGTDLSRWTARYLATVAHAHNTRPRKVLG
ncbi:helix-turn-helix domain-containing protein [Nocardia brasiliensis]|uniref:Helix-turn-helix domain-containing protein n=1 Tax=Nocardia brasiliensis TaxID=37326 RepID=A0A6G9XMM6_NOCBR|nr:helix-turn-helix domain-containing protein [Nocardia brasiliensis]